MKNLPYTLVTIVVTVLLTLLVYTKSGLFIKTDIQNNQSDLMERTNVVDPGTIQKAEYEFLKTMDFDPKSIYQTQYPNEVTPKVNFYTQNYAADLRRVCVNNGNSENDLYCDFTDYWTKDGASGWKRLQRDVAGTEGSDFCESYEKWQVAKGMPCRNLAGENSFVNF